MAPEQAFGGVMQQAADWYSVGAMLFEAPELELEWLRAGAGDRDLVLGAFDEEK
jgi:hypothetical protein